MGSLLGKSDPVGPKYYDPLGSAERVSAVAFFAAAALSIAVLLIDKISYPELFATTQIAFALSVIVLFVSGIVTRIYFAARAHSNRISDFISNSFEVPLLPDPSKGYFTTNSKGPFRRMGAFVLENTFFTKTILGKMLLLERSKIAAYGLVWFWAAFNRSTDIELLTVVAQVILSEYIISRWIRMEWLKSRVEHIYTDVYALFQLTPSSNSKEFTARVMEAVILYETSKAQAGLSISSRVFNRLNSDLSTQWKKIVSQLKIESLN